MTTKDFVALCRFVSWFDPQRPVMKNAEGMAAGAQAVEALEGHGAGNAPGVDELLAQWLDGLTPSGPYDLKPFAARVQALTQPTQPVGGR